MKTWMIGGTVAVLLGTGFYLTATKRTAPGVATPARDVAIARPQPTPPTAPATLFHVVDVADIDSLLDPPAIPVSGESPESGPVLTRVGYEEPAPAKLPNANPPPIPKSKSDDPLFTFWTGTFGGN